MIAYCLVASLGTWLFGFGGYPNTEFVRQTAESFGVGGTPDWVAIAAVVAVVFWAKRGALQACG